MDDSPAHELFANYLNQMKNLNEKPQYESGRIACKPKIITTKNAEE